MENSANEPRKQYGLKSNIVFYDEFDFSEIIKESEVLDRDDVAIRKMDT
jgi:hypothetical protein